MTESDSDDVAPTARVRTGNGRTKHGPGLAMTHAYRGAIDQATTLVATIIVAILAWAFSSGDSLHYILLVMGGVVATFFISVFGHTLWPRKRHAKGEFRESEPDVWKEDENDDEGQ